MIHKPVEVSGRVLEVEIKARVKDTKAIRERLLLRHATPSGRVHERDVYYNAPDRDFGKTDEALRLRYTEAGCVLTYKGPKVKDFRLKAREELNTGVESGPVIETILVRLGYTRVAREGPRGLYRDRGAPRAEGPGNICPGDWEGDRRGGRADPGLVPGAAAGEGVSVQEKNIRIFSMHIKKRQMKEEKVDVGRYCNDRLSYILPVTVSALLIAAAHFSAFAT
jgi:CYTH domain